MLHRFLTAGALSLIAVVGCACATDAAKQDADSSPAATAPTAQVESAAASPEAAPSPESATSPVAETEAPTARSGNFVTGEHETSGGVTLVNEGGQYFIEFAGDFSTDPGPDLFVILHRDPDVIGSTEPPAHAIAEGSYVNIAPLQTTTGSQRYPVPSEIDPSEFESVAIWCREFNATFGSATLQ
ncbi:MAG: DM13 domain-containing protein [Spirulinaceae cyanobacterium SM2_1_0]|nr:DM13 domain-containing protein [Spirulinaceae cyanobacterium SM2_1_0]